MLLIKYINCGKRGSLKTKTKYEKLDVLKGILIILVVIGHAIQYGNEISYANSTTFFSNHLFKIIYSFHMPLFMIISDYLFHYSVITGDEKYIIKSKIERLLIPSFA